MSDVIRRAAAAMLVIAAATACSAPGPARTTAPDDRVGVRRLVDATWVSDGTVGFFVDTPWSTQTAPWSLDRTLWNIELAHLDRRSTGVVAEDVVAWAEPALSGKLTSSGLPTVFQVSYAARLLTALHQRVDADAVVSTLESLRRPGGYLPDRSADEANWGATAVAVQSLHDVGRPVPAAVHRLVARRFASLEDQAPDAETAVNEAVPVLIVAAELGDASGGDVAALARRVQQVIDTITPDVVTLSATATLHQALADREIPTPAVSPAACGPARTAPGASPVAQLVFLGAVLQCDGLPHVAVQSPSTSGWIDLDAVHGNVSLLAATRAGLRLLDGRPGERTREAEVRRWLTAAWSKPLETPIDEYTRVSLLADVGEHPTMQVAVPAEGVTHPRPSTSLAAAAIGSAMGDARIRVTGSTGWLHTYVRRLVHVPAARLTLFDATALEVASRTSNRPSLHARALLVVRALAHEDGHQGYVLGNPATSLTADVLGSWIRGRALDPVGSISTGLCHDGLCRDSAGTSSESDVSLAVSAMAADCLRQGCPGGLPTYFQ